MGRILAALALCLLGAHPVGLEGRAADRSGGVAPVEAANATFSLALGVVGGSVAGQISGPFFGHSDALCFLPGTFDVAIDGADAGDLLPSSHCGSDASLHVNALADVKAGDEESRSMTLRWTDIAGRLYTLRFDGGRQGHVDRVRVICIVAGPAGCHSAVVDSTENTLTAEDGLPADTGSHARLFVSSGPNSSKFRDLGVYSVPFTLVIDGLN